MGIGASTRKSKKDTPPAQVETTGIAIPATKQVASASGEHKTETNSVEVQPLAVAEASDTPVIEVPPAAATGASEHVALAPAPSQEDAEAVRQSSVAGKSSDLIHKVPASELVVAYQPDQIVAAVGPPAADDLPSVARDSDPPSPKHNAVTHELVVAIESEAWQEAERILRDHDDCDATARTIDWGYSLLRAAAEEGELECCRLLLERRADVNARDQNAMTPLMGCVVGGDAAELVTFLLRARADGAAQTDDGFTALSWATRLDRESSISILRAAGMTGAMSCF